MNRIMVLKGGSPAIHKLGDIGRDADEFVRVYEETNDYYIGNFEEGFGFVDVKFNKADVRPVTEEERSELNGKWYTISGNPLYRIHIDKDGYLVDGKCLMKKGVIKRIVDNDGHPKHTQWHGLGVEFNEDIAVGQSAMLILEDGYVTTSRVSDVEINNDEYVIYTKNSIYYINNVKVS